MREIELRLPLGLRFQLENILSEENEWIYVAEENDQILASCQFIIDEDKAKMRQVATKKSFQGQGIGKELFQFSRNELKNMNISEINCHARKSAVPFYLNLGFEIGSDEFLEVGIPHLKMKKTI